MKFSIRDVLWLTVVVALAVSWWLSAIQFRQTNRRLEQSLVDARRVNTQLQMEAAYAESMRAYTMWLRTQSPRTRLLGSTDLDQK